MAGASLSDRAAAVLRRGWRALPDEVTSSAFVQGARRRVVTRLTGAPPPMQRVVRTLSELDEELGLLEGALATSDDALRAGFRTFRMELDRPMPPDPFSESYRQAVLDLYEWLRGSPYQVDNEMTLVDPVGALRRPFPYGTGSATTVGHQLIAVGHLVRTLGLGEGSRVLELGPGWGNLTLALAQTGCAVTAVDVSPELADLVRGRAAQVGVEIDVRVGDFSLVDSIEGPFDAVVFFESFHHSADHLRLLRSVRRLVGERGRVVFGAEPVERRFWAPWGLRLDGESLWAIRRNGWLELGFRRSYFVEALRRTGWSVTSADCPETPWGATFVASPSAT